MTDPIRVTVVGTGFIGRHMVAELERRPTYAVAGVVTRRPLDSLAGFPCADRLTNDLDAVVEGSDVVFEATGDPEHACVTVNKAFAAGKPVVTLNAEFHVTTGSHFVGQGLLTEAEGDQPGCLAALQEDVAAMGFKPLVYGNMKSFLDVDPSVTSMQYWASRQNYSVDMVTAFTDGTKVQIEQCLVANGLQAGIAKEELVGLQNGDLDAVADELGSLADELGYPISEFIVDRNLQHGVFIIARHDEAQAVPLLNYKLGNGPYYMLVKDFCLVHLEALKTIERVARNRQELLNNSSRPAVGVAAVAKKPLMPGQMIKRGYGSFEMRGICVNIAERLGHLPICLANDIVMRRHVEPGEVVMLDDVELSETKGLQAWLNVEAQCRREQIAVAAQ